MQCPRKHEADKPGSFRICQKNEICNRKSPISAKAGTYYFRILTIFDKAWKTSQNDVGNARNTYGEFKNDVFLKYTSKMTCVFVQVRLFSRNQAKHFTFSRKL